MFIEFTTTITHKIELGGDDGIAGVEHSVEIEAGEAAALPSAVIYAIVAGGCKATLRVLPGAEDED